VVPLIIPHLLGILVPVALDEYQIDEIPQAALFAAEDARDFFAVFVLHLASAGSLCSGEEVPCAPGDVPADLVEVEGFGHGLVSEAF